MTTGGKYDQRSDVWSFGITIYELAVGRFPYPSWTNVFDQLKTVVEGEPPRIPADAGLNPEFVDFVHQWYVGQLFLVIHNHLSPTNSLTHSVERRPKFKDLMEHPYIKYIEKQEVNIAEWYADILEQEQS